MSRADYWYAANHEFSCMWINIRGNNPNTAALHMRLMLRNLWRVVTG